MADKNECRSSRSCLSSALLGMLGVMAMLVTTQSAQSQTRHGCSISKTCTGPKCVGSRLDCVIKVTYNDDFGDTTRVVSCFDMINPGPEQIRIPASGNLYIVDVGGNTTARIGEPLPVLIGPAGSSENGLPGVPQNGYILLAARPAEIDERHPDLSYTIQRSDPNRLYDRAEAAWQDLCNIHPSGCSPLSNIMQSSSATSVIRPNADFTVTPDPATICVGHPTPVTYTYTVTNIGDAALSNVFLADRQCAPVTYVGGDTDRNSRLDVGETWTYQCNCTIAAPSTNTATVLADSPGPDCHLIRNAQSTVTANPDCCTGDVILNGNVNLDDLLEVINKWGLCPRPCPSLGGLWCAADIDRNCTINVDDLLTVISRWGPCP